MEYLGMERTSYAMFLTDGDLNGPSEPWLIWRSMIFDRKIKDWLIKL